MKYSLFVFCFILLCAGGVMAQTRVVHLDGDVNTSGNEVAPVVLPDGRLLFSFLQHDDANGRRLRLDEVMMYLKEGTPDADGMVGSVERVSGSLTSSRHHVGNAAYDARNAMLYFTRCTNGAEGASVCEIYRSHRKGAQWERPRSLGEPVNLEGYTSTQPAVAYSADGHVILYFVSNRPGGLGQLDIWYSIIEGDHMTQPVNLGIPINSYDNEITPYYDTVRGVLYFASDRAGGLGGYDIYASHGSRNSYSRPVAMPAPINSAQNDMYYVVADVEATYGYLSSNRSEAIFTIDSFCCNDLFLWTTKPAAPRYDTLPDRPMPVGKPTGPEEVVSTEPPAIEEPPAAEDPAPADEPKLDHPVAATDPEPADEPKLDHPVAAADPEPVDDEPPATKGYDPSLPVEPSKANPIVLYFDNDMPDPGSTDTFTVAAFDELMDRYVARQPKYLEEWANSGDNAAAQLAERSINAFFASEVQGNYQRLETFMWRIAEQLWQGRQVVLTVRGYASPVSTGAYNAILSKRRIASFVNYLRRWNQGTLRRCIDSGLLVLREVPYGSSKADRSVSGDVNDPLNSVYSVGAARERRVEIIDYVVE